MLPGPEHGAEQQARGLAARPANPRVSSRPPPMEVMRRQPALLQDDVRPTHARINLDAVQHNLRVLEQHLSSGPDRPPAIWGVVKADGYGHGAPAVAVALEEAGVGGLCVALVEEALELREGGITVPILAMGGYYQGRVGMELLVRHGITPVVFLPEQLRLLAEVAREQHAGQVAVHIKVDTGMSRLGVRPAQLHALLEELNQCPQLLLDGVMTHLACADEPDADAINHAQLDRFDAAIAVIRNAGHRPRLRHAANSAAAARLVRARYDMVRPGIALFDHAPSEEELSAKLLPAMSLHTQVIALRDIEVGEAVGYTQSWRATRPSRIATVPVGYADGVARELSAHGEVLIRGRRVPLAGKVSMDMTGIDVTDVPDVALGDEVVLLGSQTGAHGDACIRARDWADASGGIAWQVYTGISKRVPRCFEWSSAD